MKRFILFISVFLIAVACDRETYSGIRHPEISDDTEFPESWDEPPYVNASPDYSRLTADNHPRLILDDKSFEIIKSQINDATNETVVCLHKTIMKICENILNTTSDLTYKLDESGKRLLPVSKEAFKRISLCAYAYRFTGQHQYLEKAEKDIVTVCQFPDWNAEGHFLDAGEMSAAIGLAYDWLYESLAESTKETMETALENYAFNIALDGKGHNFIDKVSNWNQVCNSGLCCAALAVYENMPTVSQKIIDQAINSNRMAMSMYSPDGNYPEGPGYWEYGTVFQALMLTALRTALGTEFGISTARGFDKTARYILFTTGATGLCYNYYDCTTFNSDHPALWYFADRFSEPSLLYHEVANLKSGQYEDSEFAYLLPLVMKYASNINPASIIKPQDNIYYGYGGTPVFMYHKDWTYSTSDIFLGVKGGKASASHGHMDAGSFVYDADGVRWSYEYNRETYSHLETHIKNLGGDLWDMSQNSMRWDIYRLNNRHHSTLTINDGNHNVDGMADIVEIIDERTRQGVKLDLTDVFSPETVSVTRTVTSEFGIYLTIEDIIKTKANKDTKVRWTLVTPAQPSKHDKYILLESSSKRRYLSVSARNITPELQIWSTDPAVYSTEISRYEEKNNGFYECGWEAIIPGGQTVVFKTQLSPENNL